jgi:hypothetical protein
MQIGVVRAHSERTAALPPAENASLCRRFASSPQLRMSVPSTSACVHSPA